MVRRGDLRQTPLQFVLVIGHDQVQTGNPVKSSLDFYGWSLFLVCGLMWIIQALLAKDVLGTLVGGT
ncbi:hypothetical protein FIM12_04185 [SAR202 cluster bacterium AD-804-J14_MRT_500m]|nr:hypothetical protein [SAR202 cluster bacterium AD-804-J14_MRT_500m]